MPPDSLWGQKTANNKKKKILCTPAPFAVLIFGPSFQAGFEVYLSHSLVIYITFSMGLYFRERK